MILGHWLTRARILGIIGVDGGLAGGGGVGSMEARRRLIARNLGRHALTSRELEDVFGVRRIVKVSMKPPFLEVVMLQRCYRTIVIIKSGLCDIESPHGGVPDRSMGSCTLQRRGKEQKCESR